MQHKFPQLLLASATLYGFVMAHFNFEALIVNGVTTQPYEYVRRVTNSNSPVTSVDDDNIRCNVGGSNGTWSQTKTQAVNAGDKIGFTINQNIGHPGPMNVYLSKDTGSDLSAYDGSGDWIKIYYEGADANSAGLQWSAAGATTVVFLDHASKILTAMSRKGRISISVPCYRRIIVVTWWLRRTSVVY